MHKGDFFKVIGSTEKIEEMLRSLIVFSSGKLNELTTFLFSLTEVKTHLTIYKGEQLWLSLND